MLGCVPLSWYDLRKTSISAELTLFIQASSDSAVKFPQPNWLATNVKFVPDGSLIGAAPIAEDESSIIPEMIGSSGYAKL